MSKKSCFIVALFVFVWGISFSQNINLNKKRADEIKEMMWKSGDADFSATVAPEKWKTQSAVILAKSNALYYKKSLIGANLNFDTFNHYRIKLQDNNAIEKYAQFSLPSTDPYGANRNEVYAGFKIVKADGKEVNVPITDAVLQKQELNSQDYNSYKIAIPNLEIGDIIDYYICEEESIYVPGKYYAFDPVIFQLHAEYPIVKQKISFEVLRRCYINLKSLNGAPQFKLTNDDANDKTYYSIVDADRESIKDIRWLFPYRELPTIKFKVTYASSLAASYVPGFIGEPGVIKSSVSDSEIRDLFKFIFNYSASGAWLKSHMNKNFKGVTDKDKLAREAFYALRYFNRFKNAEDWLLNGTNSNPDVGLTSLITSLSDYYKVKKINHEILIGIPRQISGLENLILENELTLMLKVNTPTPFYVGRFENNAMPGEIDTDLQGAQVYSTSGLLSPSSWVFTKVNVPVESHEQNNITNTNKLTITDLAEGVIEMNISASMKGMSRVYHQNMLMDFYDYQDEEKNRYEKGSSPKASKALVKKRDDYKASREENRKKQLETVLKENYEFTVENARDLQILQPGRFDDKPEFMYTCKADAKDVIKKVGPNYLLDIGKFIEGQIKLTNEEKERKYNIYMSYASSFTYRIEMQLPDGYTVQGVEKLNVNVENETGGFKSNARIEKNTLIIETLKHYKSNYQKKDKWPLMVAFMDAASEFNQKQILLEKIK